MTTAELEALGFAPQNVAADKDITGGFCGDLLSWAMSRTGEGQVWFTVMGNINAVAVANLADAAAVVVCHGAVLAPDALEKAQEHEINVYTTALPEYEAAVLFASAFAGADAK